MVTSVRYPNALQCVNVNIMSEEVCRRAYSGIITSGMVCAGVPQGGKDSCQVRPRFVFGTLWGLVLGTTVSQQKRQRMWLEGDLRGLKSRAPLNLTLLRLSFLFYLINFLGLWKQYRVACIYKGIWGPAGKPKLTMREAKTGVKRCSHLSGRAGRGGQIPGGGRGWDSAEETTALARGWAQR